LFINAELSTLPISEGRKAERRILNIAAALREEGATTATVFVIDISPGGFKIQSDEPPLEGTEVWLKLPGFEAKRSRVIWAKDKEAGCEFENELHAAEIETLVAPRRKQIPKNVFRRV
jgi:PilZ domain-containing protein